MSLFIGAYLPDRQLDDSVFCKALTKVAMNMTQFRKHPLQASKDKPHLDLYFLMPGRDEVPEFEGMRFHSFDSTSNTLKIESSVPRKMIESEYAEHYVVASMQDAVDGASDFFEIKDMDFQRDEYLELISTLSTSKSVVIH